MERRSIPQNEVATAIDEPDAVGELEDEDTVIPGCEVELVD